MFNGRELVSVAGKAGKPETQHSTAQIIVSDFTYVNLSNANFERKF